MKKQLDELYETFDRAAHRAVDPVSFVHRYRKRADQEIVGLLASSLAFGNVTAARASIQRVLDVLNKSPSTPVARRALLKRLGDFRHRVYRGEDVTEVLVRGWQLQKRHGSIGNRFAVHLHEQPKFQLALAALADELRGPTERRGLRHLIPDPRKKSACKRLLLYLRWMVRDRDGVDLGLWKGVDASELLIPVDTHVHRIATNLGLTNRRTADWATAEQITGNLRAFDAGDPVKYDFALCHLGISKACPSKRDEAKCRGCVLKPVCRNWTVLPRTSASGFD